MDPSLGTNRSVDKSTTQWKTDYGSGVAPGAAMVDAPLRADVLAGSVRGLSPNRRRQLAALRLASTLALVVGGARVARAEPTKDECVDADESAQAARTSGRLREARDRLAVCVDRVCPAL